ncbi:MAG: SdrD B-like domain-containing protein, partial [Saprospiraceae bacterium]
VDEDGICDDVDDCVGELDALGESNGEWETDVDEDGLRDDDDCTENDAYNTDCQCVGTLIDVDDDGICDNDDDCIGELDALGECNGGCEADVDEDGICDDVDDCIGELDALGVCEGDCEADVDEDGICDDVDDCVGELDALGVCDGDCEADVDEDGICDDIDDCIGDLDALGECDGDCEADVDEDGICDDVDDCVGELDALGECNGDCEADVDEDGICDDVDDCVGELDALGECDGDCEADVDEDGICDDIDDCVGELDALGECDGDCEADVDEDGICDDVDDCIGELDAVGVCNGDCTEDADGDGICDDVDSCPDFDNNQIGEPCDDGNSNTTNDVFTANCECVGTQNSPLVIDCPTDIEMTATSDNGAIVAFDLPTATTGCDQGGGGTGGVDCTNLNLNNFTELGTLNGNTYFLSSGSTRWNNAVAIAAQLGGRLVGVSSAAEEAFLNANVNTYIHVGISDSAVEGTFKTTSGGTISAGTINARQSPFFTNTESRDYVVRESWSGNGGWELVGFWTRKKFVVVLPCGGDSNGGGGGIELTQTSGLSSGATFPIGISDVTFSAADDCGNLTTCTFQVSVLPREICDGIDNNGNGQIDEGLTDTDNDGICDDIDPCPTSPDNEDGNGNGKPDGCEVAEQGSISGRAFNDLNNNGLQDAGEGGIGNIFVSLSTGSGFFQDYRFTDANGNYRFPDLAAGTYRIKIANPGNGFNGVTQNVGNDDNIDSDVNNLGRSGLLELAEGQSLDIDGGFHKPTEPVGDDYCIPENNRPWTQWISNVTFGDINNNSGKNGYGAFLGQQTTLQGKRGYPISVRAGFSYYHYKVKISAWIDYNQNGTFENDERVFSRTILREASLDGQTNSAPVTGEITIPAAAVAGATRMRVALQRDDAPNSCASGINGEVEDYTVIISDGVGGNLLTIADQFHFVAYQKEQAVKMQWGTNTGNKNDYFVIQRSTNGNDFEDLQTIDNQHVDEKVHFYSALDESPVYGDNYYRLIQYFTDGTQRISEIQQIEFKVNLNAISVYPNPAINEINLSLGHLVGQKGQVQIVNIYGEILHEQPVDQFERTQTLSVQQLQNGLYQVFVIPERGKVQAVKVVVGRMY